MAAPSDSLLKVNWAEDYFKRLDDSVGRFLNSNPCTVRPDVDTEKREVKLYAKCLGCPSDWGLLVGDIVNNLRCALDYIVDRASTLAATDKARWYIGFQICDNPGEFHDRKSKRLNGVDSGVADFIESCQPYKGGGLNDPLALLQKINNGDKHHAIRVVSAVGRNHGIGMSGYFDGLEFGPGQFTIKGCTNITVGGVVATAFDVEIPEHEVQVLEASIGLNNYVTFDAKITPEIQFGKGQNGVEGREVVPTMRLILDSVKEICAKCP